MARYADFAIDFGIDAVAIFLMAYVLYFRRHWRSDLLLSYVTLNLGIFTVMSILSVVRVDIAVGFGLFAILSIIRLRSSAVTQQEVAYYFVALVMGLVNGINLGDRWLLVLMNVLLLATMFVVDSRPLRERSRRVEVSLKKLYSSDADLVADLEQRLGGRVMYHEVTQIDYVHSHTSVDVRYRPGTGVAVPQPVEQPAAGAAPIVVARVRRGHPGDAGRGPSHRTGAGVEPERPARQRCHPAGVTDVGSHQDHGAGAGGDHAGRLRPERRARRPADDRGRAGRRPGGHRGHGHPAR